MNKNPVVIDKTLSKALSCLNETYGIVVISGASSGIGEALAAYLLNACKDVRVFNLSRSESAFSGENFTHINCDISKTEDIDRAFSQIIDFQKSENLTDKKILLINNAGFGGYGLFPDPNIGHNSAMIDVNIRGLTYMSGKFIEPIRSSGGGIINVASTAAFQPCPYLNVYAATKSYVLNFSLALDYELKKFGANCLCLCPGPTSTNFFKRAGFEKRPLDSDFGHTSEQVARACLLAYMRGKKLKIVGGLNLLQYFMARFVPLTLIGVFSGWILSKFRN